MFILEGKLTFINIDQNYLRKLHDACSEVYYKPSGYENKPYIGILINKNDRKYVIPLSSAKEKHKKSETSFSNFFRSMILKPLKISRMRLRICLAAPPKR